MNAPRTRCLRASAQLLGVASLLVALAAAPRSLADEAGAAVAALEESLARDRARLIELLGQPRGEDVDATAGEAELREIAERMPRTQAALRARASTPPDGPQTGNDRD